MQSNKVRGLVTCAMIAALYTAVTFVLAPISFLAVQVRVSEALTLLPVFDPMAIVGVTIGCMLSNLIGFMTGANILGWMDILFGTAATFFAAWMSWMLRSVRYKNIPWLSAIPPILVNAVIIGGELTVVMSSGWDWKIFLLNAVSVGAGQLVSCGFFGLVLVAVLQKADLDKRLFQNQAGYSHT